MNIVIICLLVLIIILFFFAFFIIMKFLVNLQTQFDAFHRLQDIYYKDLVDKLRLLRYYTILKIRELCIKEERYEDIQTLDNILRRDFSDIIKNNNF